MSYYFFFFFFSSRRRHTRFKCDWSSDVCSSDLAEQQTKVRTFVCCSARPCWWQYLGKKSTAARELRWLCRSDFGASVLRFPVLPRARRGGLAASALAAPPSLQPWSPTRQSSAEPLHCSASLHLNTNLILAL